jgi:peptidoglycan/LPS O-acetylase OafA/YrhL
MHLHNRLWQFICGFFAYYVHNEDLSRFYKKKERLIFIASESFNFLLFFLLLVCMFTNFIDVIQISRFFVVFITTLILSKRTASIFLSLDAVVLIGDISYSIYLIHWPIFTLHRYWFVDAYFDRNTHPTFIGMTILEFKH